MFAGVKDSISSTCRPILNASAVHESFLSMGCGQQTLGIDPMLAYCWPNVHGTGPTLNLHWFNVPCFLWFITLATHSFVGSLRDREVVCLASERQGWNFESCVCRAVSFHLYHHPRDVLLAQFSLLCAKGGLKPHSFLQHRNTVTDKHETWSQCWFNIGTPSTTLVQR